MKTTTQEIKLTFKGTIFIPKIPINARVATTGLFPSKTKKFCSLFYTDNSYPAAQDFVANVYNQVARKAHNDFSSVVRAISALAAEL